MKVPYNLGSLSLQDEDLGGFSSDRSLGLNTAGIWSPTFDGSAHNLSANDVVGADSDDVYLLQGTKFRFVFNAAKTLDGVTFVAGDIAECFDSWYDEEVACDSRVKFFDASNAGIAGVKIDAFEVGRKE